MSIENLKKSSISATILTIIMWCCLLAGITIVVIAAINSSISMLGLIVPIFAIYQMAKGLK